MENKLDDSTVCACYPQVTTKAYTSDLSEESESSEPVPDVCPKCRKPTGKNQIIVQICDGTTPERFPEEWNKNRNK